MGSPWRPAGVIGFLLARAEVAMSYRVGTETQTWVLCESSKHLEPLDHHLRSSVPLVPVISLSSHLSPCVPHFLDPSPLSHKRLMFSSFISSIYESLLPLKEDRAGQ